MRFDVLTLFPEMLEAVLGQSIIGRARDKGILELNFINIRDFTEDKHKRVDDYAYGGGTGLVMGFQPIYSAYKELTKGLTYKPLTVYMSPQGKVLTQKAAHAFLEHKHIVILCGHYEGVDERVLEEIVDVELSVGDYVLTGGEIPAMAFIDSVARMVDGVLPDEAAYSEESHYNGLLEYPQYTRPVDIMGHAVPEVLLSGHHKNINIWRRQQALYRTWLKRPDMLKKAELTEADKKFLNRLKGKRRIGKKAVYMD